MRRLLLLTVLVVFVVWRGRRLDASDRRHGFGAYAPVIPTLQTVRPTSTRSR